MADDEAEKAVSVTDWAGWGTAAGTLVLAGATFAAVRSSSRSARVAERALLAGLRPLLVTSRSQDPAEQVQFADGRTFEAKAERAMVRRENGIIYLAIPLRNVGSGIAVLHGYHLEPEVAERVAQDPLGAARHKRGDRPSDQSVFLEQQRDLYVPAADRGFWQAALRDPDSDLHAAATAAIETAGRITVDLLYCDHEGSQPTITRFVLLADEDESWRCDVTRHWNLESSRRRESYWGGAENAESAGLSALLLAPGKERVARRGPHNCFGRKGVARG